LIRAVYDDAKVSHWIIERTPYPQRRGFDISPPPLRGIGYEVDGLMVAGFMFYNHASWNKSVEVGVALETKSPVLRHIMRDVMKYPYQQLQCERVTAYVPKRATKSRKLVEALGFVEEGNMRLGFGTDHCMVYGLLKKDAEARWKYGSLQVESVGYDRLNERPNHA